MGYQLNTGQKNNIIQVDWVVYCLTTQHVILPWKY